MTMDKKVALRLITTVCFLGLVVQASCATAEDSGTVLHATVGKPFRIVLESNPSTGYRWSASYGEGFLKLEESTYEKPAKPLPGAPGKEVFVFVPLRAGETEISMKYERPWESAPVKTQTFRILISAAKIPR